MRRLLVITLALVMILASVSVEAGSRGGRGSSGKGVRPTRFAAGYGRSTGYRTTAAPSTYYRSSYSSYPSSYAATSYSPSYVSGYGQSYVSSYLPVVSVATQAMEVSTVAPAQVWYPPPPPGYMQVQPAAAQEDWQQFPATVQEQSASSSEETRSAGGARPSEDDMGTLIIAIGTNYSDRTDIPHLKYADSDTIKVYDTLCSRQDGPVTGVLLVGEDATRRNILDSIDKARSWRGPVLFYFSGHGSPDLTGKEHLGYLVASDTDTSYPARLQKTAVSLSGIWEQLRRSEAESVFAAVDVCFTGTGKSLLTDGAKPLIVGASPPAQASGDEDQQVVIDGQSSSRILLLSSSANQPSWEDGKRLKGGIFTHYLLAGLMGAAGTRGEVNVQDLIRYVKREVKAAARKLKGVDQTPQAVGEGEFVVARNDLVPETTHSTSRLVPSGQDASRRQAHAQY